MGQIDAKKKLFESKSEGLASYIKLKGLLMVYKRCWGKLS